MAHHDFIDQAATAILAGKPTNEIIARAAWSGLDWETIDTLLEIAKDVAAG